MPQRKREAGPARDHERADARRGRTGIEAFAAAYDAKYPKAVASLRRDQAQLVTFYDFSAEHWRYLRTTNIIESPFATVGLRQRVTQGAVTYQGADDGR